MCIVIHFAHFRSMKLALILFSLLGVFLAHRELIEIFVYYYSGADHELTSKELVWLIGRPMLILVTVVIVWL